MNHSSESFDNTVSQISNAIFEEWHQSPNETEPSHYESMIALHTLGQNPIICPGVYIKVLRKIKEIKNEAFGKTADSFGMFEKALQNFFEEDAMG